MTTFDSLLGSLLGVPSLPGARCRGRSHLFDPPEHHEHPETVAQRHAQAISLCSACPARRPCREWLDGLTPSKRPLGVVAGRIVRQRPTKREAS
jgi:hypothetical protein